MSVFKEAYEATDDRLINLKGLTHALYDLATDFDGLNKPGDAAEAIIALVRTVENEARAICDLHTKEWEAAKPQSAV